MATKLNRKQLQQRQKAKTICKWVLCGLGWSLLLAGFISLVVVGVRGCANKKQTPATAITTPVKPQQPSNVVIPTNTTGDNNNPPLIEPATRIAGIIGANELGTSFERYTWERNIDSDPHNFGYDYGLFYLGCSTLSLGKITAIGVNSSDNITTQFNYIERDYESNTIEFSLNNILVLSLDERDWSQVDKWQKITIDFNNVSSSYISDNASLYQYGWAYRGVINGYTFEQADIGLLLSSFMSSEDIFIQGAGQESGETGLLGVFSLIAQVFGSFASLFNWHILPGITIGTFIALPLVATAIFFIVKLFKR